MFDAYRKWLGIPPKDQPPNHYRLLGVELFEDDLDVIEGAADRQMAFIRQYQSGEHATEAANILNELAAARLCLLKPATKTAYDAKLRQQLAPAEAPTFDMALNVDDVKPLSRPAKRTKPSTKSSSAGGPKPLVIAGGIAAAVIAVAAVVFSIGRPKQPIEVPATAKQVAPIDSTPSKSDQTGAASDAANLIRPDSTADSTPSAESLGTSVDLLKQNDLKRDAIAGDSQQTTSSSDEVVPMTPQFEAPFTTVRNDVPVTRPSIVDTPSTATESDITVSQSPTAAKKGEWIDLLKWSEGLDWSSSGVNWNDHLAAKPTRNGIRMKTSPLARFPLPAIIDGDYEMEIEFKR